MNHIVRFTKLSDKLQIQKHSIERRQNELINEISIYIYIYIYILQ